MRTKLFQEKQFSILERMGLKLSTNNSPRLRTYSGSSPSGTSNGGNNGIAVRAGGSGARARARSFGSFQTGQSSSLNIPANLPIIRGNSPDSDSSSPEDGSAFGRTFTHSLPVQLFALQGIKCPVCSKFITAEDIECHLVMCLTKPRISYNEDVLNENKGECVICFDDLVQGDTIARLPCLCIYHKGCIDKWFEVNRSCPEHPSD